MRPAFQNEVPWPRPTKVGECIQQLERHNQRQKTDSSEKTGATNSHVCATDQRIGNSGMEGGDSDKLDCAFEHQWK
jgi:hypothetical protein